MGQMVPDVLDTCSSCILYIVDKFEDFLPFHRRGMGGRISKLK